MMVAMKLTPPMMVPKPPRPRPIIQRFPPMPGENVVEAKGWYANQPNEAAPCGVKKADAAIKLPKVYSQNASALSRGKATSGAPI